MVTATQDHHERRHCSLEEALHEVVQALGGAKAVGSRMWPTKDPVEAARWLNHCLDSDRPEKPTLGEVEWLLREGRKAGCHAGMHYLADSCLYARPVPFTCEQRKAELQQKFVDAVNQLERLRVEMERL